MALRSIRSTFHTINHYWRSLMPADPVRPLTDAEWLDRYEAAFVARGVPIELAKQCRVAESFATLSDGYADDPEGAAEMELSYWENDCAE